MNNKELYKKVRENVKVNFWIYLVAALIFFLLSAAVSNGFGVFSDIGKIIYAIRNGNFNYQQLSNPESQLWAYLAAGGEVAASSAAGIIVTALSFFLVNPLGVGVKSVFISGVDERPAISKLSEPLKKSYLNIVITMLLSNLVLEAIIVAIAVVYMVAMAMAGTFISGIGTNQGTVLFSVAAVILTVLYLIFAVRATYSFSMIGYILAEHPGYRLSQVLYYSRKMVHKKKWQIFKVDFHYLKWSALSVIIPMVIFGLGMMKMSLATGGMLYIILSIFMIIPVLCINLFISIFKDSAWAHMYKELKIDKEVNAQPDETEAIEETEE